MRRIVCVVMLCFLVGAILQVKPAAAAPIAAPHLAECETSSDIRTAGNIVFFSHSNIVQGGTYGWSIGNYNGYTAKTDTSGVTVTVAYYADGTYYELGPFSAGTWSTPIPADTTMAIVVINTTAGTVEMCPPPAPTATPTLTTTPNPTTAATATPESTSLPATATPTPQPPHLYAVSISGDITVPSDLHYPDIPIYQYNLPYSCGAIDTEVGFYYNAVCNGTDCAYRNTVNGDGDLTNFPLGGNFYNEQDIIGQDAYTDQLIAMGLPVVENHHWVTSGWGQWDRIGIRTWGTSSVTLTNVKAICYGSNEPEPPDNQTNLLCDGDMEQYYTSECWQQSDFGTITRPNGSTAEYTWNRLNTEQAPWPLSWSTWWSNGDALCGTGYHGIGLNAVIGTNLFAGQGKGVAAAIEQPFSWAGGTLYWRASARGRFMRFFPTPPPGKALVTIFGDGTEYRLLNAEDLAIDWQTFSGSIDLPAGQYRIKLDSWEKENFLINTIDDGAVYYDDVYLSETALSGDACESNHDWTTPTPSLTPQGTITPDLTATAATTATIDPSMTAEVTPTGIGGYTPTPDTTPTPTPNPDLLYIWNCGFEAGKSAWGFNQTSSLVLAGGPTGPQALKATGTWPAAWQNFISKGAQTYMTTWIKGKATIQAVNTETNATIIYYQSDNYEWAWKKIYATAFIPAGNWRLELNNTNPPDSEAYYDGVTLAYNSYATGTESWCALEPTQGPTSFVTPTPVPTATIGASSTPRPTATLAPWWTPVPTATPRPQATNTPDVLATDFWRTATALGTPNNTATPGATGTPDGTGTPGATSTPGILGTPGTLEPTGTPGTVGPPGTGTPSWRGTPMITPGYGNDGIGGSDPGGVIGPCPKPDFWTDGFGTWVDAAVCEVKAYFAFGPGNVDQIAQFQRQLQVYEPFGTLKELSDANSALRGLASMYAWNNTGLPGTDVKGDVMRPLAQLPPNWLSGNAPLRIQASGPAYSTHCSNSVTNYAGQKLAPGMCFIFDILYQNGLMPIVQVVIDASCLMAVFMYINNNFIKPHS